MPAGSTTSACDLHALYTWPARDDNVPIPPWTPTPAESVEAGPNAKAEKADKVPYLRDKKYSPTCAAVLHRVIGDVNCRRADEAPVGILETELKRVARGVVTLEHLGILR